MHVLGQLLGGHRALVLHTSVILAQGSLDRFIVVLGQINLQHNSSIFLSSTFKIPVSLAVSSNTLGLSGIVAKEMNFPA